jgi:hypothetical protein
MRLNATAENHKKEVGEQNGRTSLAGEQFALLFVPFPENICARGGTYLFCIWPSHDALSLITVSNGEIDGARPAKDQQGNLEPGMA